MTDAPSAFPQSATVAIVGVGLIGGSIAAALKSRGHRGRILGIGRNAERLRAAVDQGLLDDFATQSATVDADLWIVCTPVDRIAADVRTAAAAAKPGTLLTDAGSVKGPICRDVTGLPAGVTFLGSHPLAGSEKRGFEYADADLFRNRLCVITPSATVDENDIARLMVFWQSLGMYVMGMSPEAHDAAVAQTSHLPHVVAAALAGSLQEEQRPLTATGFADTTRIAAGDPELWTAILLQNAAAVDASLSRFEEELRRFRGAIAARDGSTLKELLQHAKSVRAACVGDGVRSVAKPSGTDD